MNKSTNNSNKSEISLNQVAGELLEVLIDEQDPYLWDCTEPQAENYFSKLEENFSLLDGLAPEEIEAQAEHFFTKLQERWDSCSVSPVKQSLFERFGKLMPTGWLDTIIEQSQQVVAANQSLLEQVVECVEPLLSNWTTEDLHLLARPYTLALRDGSAQQHTPWEHTPWTELSEIDRIRLAILVAKEAITQLQLEVESPQ